jgi:hypothetical protein
VFRDDRLHTTVRCRTGLSVSVVRQHSTHIGVSGRFRRARAARPPRSPP